MPLKATLCLALAIVASTGCGKRQGFRSRAAPIRGAWTILSKNEATIPPQRLATAGRLLGRGNPEQDRAIREYLLARAGCVAGKAGIRFSRADVSFVAEDVFLMRDILAEEPWRETCRPYHDILARLMPGRAPFLKTVKMQPRMHALVTPPLPTVPMLWDYKLRKCASLLEQAGLYDLAWRVYLEGAAFPPRWGESINNSSLCPSVAPLSLKIARAARLARRDDIAWQFLMKAAVFGDESVYESSLSLAEEWENEDALAEKTGTPRPEPEPIPLDTRREALTQAVRLCAECNAHPRAWALIDAHPDAFEDPVALRKEITDGWRAIVDTLVDYLQRYTGPEHPKTLTIYGTTVYPDGDPLAVKIPWPFSDDAMEYARKRMREIQAEHGAETAQ